MTMVGSLLAEFEREAQTTRKHLERLPDDKFGWRPHQKSFTAGDLASHLVECIGWAHTICTQDELDIDPKTYKSYQAKSSAELLKTFDEKVATSRQALANATDETIIQTWRFKTMGRVRFEKTRAEVLRDFNLSHLIHHRGQFSVYLRLLDISVPGSYGPSADEQG
jgi:uncharacterized damage-inducible protein DinB